MGITPFVGAADARQASAHPPSRTTTNLAATRSQSGLRNNVPDVVEGMLGAGHWDEMGRIHASLVLTDVVQDMPGRNRAHEELVRKHVRANQSSRKGPS
jgi:hypothetical protein